MQICENCGKGFFGRNKQKYCGYNCRKASAAKRYREKKKGNKIINTNIQPCWTCERSCGGCSWSKDLIPIKGWTAKPTVLKFRYKDNSISYVDTYMIYKCPLYIQDYNDPDVERTTEFVEVCD